MSPPSALHRSGGCAPALSPHLKIFLSGCVLFLGIVGTLPFYQANQAQSLPASDGQNLVSTIPTEITMPLPIGEPQGTVPVAGSSFDHVPAAIASQTEKYAKAYPEPVLASEVPSSESVRPLVETPPRPPLAPIQEFSSIHRLTPSLITPIERQDVTFDGQPECIDSSKLADSLLPMFHFAENLKPISMEIVEQTPPENPFQPPDDREVRKLSPLRPYVELRPLRLPEKN